MMAQKRDESGKFSRKDEPAKKGLDGETPLEKLDDLKSGEPEKEPEKAKPRRTRRTKADKLEFEISSEMYGTCWILLFNIVAKRAGEHWNISAKEGKDLGGATKRVMDKYLPKYLSDKQELVALGITLSVVVTPRLLYAPGSYKKPPESDTGA